MPRLERLGFRIALWLTFKGDATDRWNKRLSLTLVRQV